MRDSQEENGRIPNTSPTLVGGMGGGVAWGSAYILIPWWMNHYYGDTRILKEHYPTMKKYLGYLTNLGTCDEDPSEPISLTILPATVVFIGEWCAGTETIVESSVVNTFFIITITACCFKIAESGLPKMNNIPRFGRHHKNAFNRKFYNTNVCLWEREPSDLPAACTCRGSGSGEKP